MHLHVDLQVMLNLMSHFTGLHIDPGICLIEDTCGCMHSSKVALCYLPAHAQRSHVTRTNVHGE